MTAKGVIALLVFTFASLAKSFNEWLLGFELSVVSINSLMATAFMGLSVVMYQANCLMDEITTTLMVRKV